MAYTARLMGLIWTQLFLSLQSHCYCCDMGFIFCKLSLESSHVTYQGSINNEIWHIESSCNSSTDVGFLTRFAPSLFVFRRTLQFSHPLYRDMNIRNHTRYERRILKLLTLNTTEVLCGIWRRNSELFCFLKTLNKT